MEAKEWTTVDKSKYLTRGEWDAEPDKMQWQDEATGLPCLIVRGPDGALCGYVGVAEGHKFYEQHYDAVEIPREDDNKYPDVHGGLTFADFCADTKDESKHICHIPGPGEPHKVWWFGFDCAHSGDLCPGYHKEFPFDDYASYKDVRYVKREVTKLAAQLKSAS